MSDQRTVVGIIADLADEFNPQQWVNVYRLDSKRREEYLHYQGRYQVKDLPAVFAGSPAAEFALEPLDEQGNIISVQQAFDSQIERSN